MLLPFPKKRIQAEQVKDHILFKVKDEEEDEQEEEQVDEEEDEEKEQVDEEEDIDEIYEKNPDEIVYELVHAYYTFGHLKRRFL